MHRPNRTTSALLLVLALMAIVLGVSRPPGAHVATATAAVSASSSTARARQHRIAPRCHLGPRGANGHRTLRPRGCAPYCPRWVRTGHRLVKQYRPCVRPPRPDTAIPSGAGLVGALGGASTRINPEVRSATTAPAHTSGAAAPGGGTARTLVLYDTTGPYGWLGELYAMSAANLASHFGSWTAAPVSSYTAGKLNDYTATIYLGSTYDEPLPAAFLDDVHGTTKPVIWIYDNIWALSSRFPDFQAKYGWQWWKFDTSDIASVRYKGVDLGRSLLNRGGIMDYASLDATRVTTLATAKRADGTTLPWAVRSGNLTYIGENPFAYTSETDRDLAFVDLLYDALAPTTPERHRALVRIEDIGPDSDPAQLRAVADALYRRHIPFGFGVSAQYRDPKQVNGTTTSRTLAAAPQVVTAIRYMQARGGVMVNHGLTHQYSNVANPYDGVSGNDFEFYRVTENADHTLNFAGPVPENSLTWARNRMLSANAGFMAAGLQAPRIFEFPHYTGSVEAYQAAAGLYPTRWERGMYFSGVMRGGAVDYARPIGQRFPFVVRDIYGSTVLPENIGSYEPEAFHQFPVHTVADILKGVDSNKVVRDGFASFYFHPFWGPAALEQALDGLTARGWQFVSPATLG